MHEKEKLLFGTYQLLSTHKSPFVSFYHLKELNLVSESDTAKLDPVVVINNVNVCRRDLRLMPSLMLILKLYTILSNKIASLNTALRIDLNIHQITDSRILLAKK